MKAIELPTLSHFQNGNGWLGSAGLLRFQIEKPEEEQMTVALWQGPYSRPYAQVFAQETFPVTEEGREALLAYLNGKAQEMEETPVFTPEETDRVYWDKKKEEAAPKE